MQEWLAWCGNAIEPLFCGIYQGVPVNRPLGTAKVTLIVKEAIAASGGLSEEVAVIIGHSLHISTSNPAGLNEARSPSDPYEMRIGNAAGVKALRLDGSSTNPAQSPLPPNRVGVSPKAHLL